jgi:hypothetical protein
MFPDIVHLARADRAFLGRAVRYLAGQAGIRQFLDVGTGLPTADNTHQVAQAIAPECRIIYVDNDPLVLKHARALLSGTPQGAIDYTDADLREPDKVVREAAETLDFTQPVAVMLLGGLHHIEDDSLAQAIVDRLVEALPSGGYPTIAHSTNQVTGAAMDEAVAHWNEFGKPSMTLRTPGNRPVLRPPGFAGAWRGLDLPVAARSRRDRLWPHLRDRRVLRGRPQAVRAVLADRIRRLPGSAAGPYPARRVAVRGSAS